MINSITIIGAGRVGTSLASYGVTELRNDGVTEVRNDGVTEVRNDGVTEVRNDGVTEVRNDGVTEVRNDGVTELRRRHSREGGNPSSNVLHPTLISARTFCTDPESIAIPKSDVIVLATKDSLLAEVITKLAKYHAEVLHGALVLHVNGSLGTDILEPLRHHRALIAAAHPFQTFSKADPALLHGIGWGVLCDDRSWPFTEEFVRRVGGFPFRLPKTDAISKRRYHASAVAASNFTYAAYDLARRLAEDVGLPVEEFLGPIMRQTLENALEAMKSNAPFPITGPLVRADEDAVQRQLDSMPMHLKDQYVHLTEALRKVVTRDKRRETRDE